MRDIINYHDSVKEAIIIAMVQLLKRKSFYKISIQEITNRAGVGRSSFYRNFNSKEDVIISYIYYLIDDVPPVIGKTNELWCKHMASWFSIVRREKDFFLALKRDELLHLLFISSKQYTSQLMKEIGAYSSPFQNIYFSSAGVGVIIYWIENGFKESEDELAAIIFGLVTGKTESVRNVKNDGNE